MRARRRLRRSALRIRGAPEMRKQFGEALRSLPAVHRLLDEPAIVGYTATLGREGIKGAIERVLDRARASGETHAYEGIVAAVIAQLETMRMRGMIPVINATGVMLHTNLGRAPLAPDALA